MDLESIKCLEYSTIKVPYEILNKTYRNSQKDIDREISHLNNIFTKYQNMNLSELSDPEEQRAKLIQAVGEVEARLEQFQATVTNSIQAQQDNLQHCRERAEHLKEFAGLYEAHAKASSRKSRREPTEKSEELKQFEKSRVNRIVVDHLLRTGHFDTAVSLSKETGISHLVDIDLFQETREIERELRIHNPDPCLAWCLSNKSKLRKLNSNLECNIRLQQFIELVRVGMHSEAILHARKYLTQVDDSFLGEVQSAMGLLAFPTDTRFSHYQELLSETRWEDLITKFRTDNYSILQMSSQSLLVTTLQAGLSALKTHQCYNPDKKNNNCPVCIPPFNELAESLPFAKYTRSRLLCSLTNTPMDEDNPPMALHNGRMYGEKGILQRIDDSGKFTCPVTKESFLLSECLLMRRSFDKKRVPKRKAPQTTNLLNSEKKSRSYSPDNSSRNSINSNFRFLLPTKEKNTLTYRAVEEKKNIKITNLQTNPVLQNEESCDKFDRQMTTTELICRRDELLKLRKEKIAIICNKLIEEPYFQCKLLPSLIPFCTEQESVIAITVRKLGILSTLAVIKDIMPGYKVREDYGEEGHGKMVSKQVKQARTFETTFLSFYQLYLNILQLYITHKISKTASLKTKSILSDISNGMSTSSEGRKELSIVAMQCVCELLIDKPHFNFTSNLVNLVVGQLANEAPNRRTARDCLIKVFQIDLVGEISLEIMKGLADVMKKKSYKLSPIVLQPILHLPLGQDATGALTSSDSTADDYHKKKFGMSRKEKKITKLKRKVERDTRETRAGESRSYVSQVRSRIANIVFSIYIHILKLERSGPLLSPALEGVSHFSHIISVEYFLDLLRYLSELLSASSKLSFKQKLFCLHTSCTVLFSQKTQDINIDPKAICRQMYCMLLDLPYELAWELANLLVSTLHLMLNNSQCMHQERSLGFAKRICTSSLVKTPSMTSGLLFSLRSLLLRDYISDNLLSNESLAGARYKPEIQDPDICDAKSSCLWELCLFRSHFHPVISKLGECLSEGSALVGKRNNLKIASDKYRTSREIMEAVSHIHTDPFDGLIMYEQVDSKKRKEKIVKKYHTNVSNELNGRAVIRKRKGSLDFHFALSS
ncbi:Macrophage erythroblast attacher [Oopsacas minuta]|uniref:NOC3-like protein n=1 Tax=Oopsacas minuta TaxID=111878 RepID=A0AAV7K180_9METZ|nr:Macrophage erythroblast attacher [Oopsacas minuta]